MKKFFIYFLLSISFLLGGCKLQNHQNFHMGSRISRTLYENSIKSIIGLLPYEVDNPEYFSCAGVIISRDQILTAEHCVSHDRYTIFGQRIPGESPLGDIREIVTYQMYNNSEFSRSISYEVIATDEDLDLALLQRRDLMVGYATVMRLFQGRTLNIGDLIFSIGHPGRVPYNLSEGYVSRVAEKQGRRWNLYSTIPAWHGNSGGPIIDSRGRLVGITSIIVDGQNHLNKAIHFRSIREFLRDSNVTRYLLP